MKFIIAFLFVIYCVLFTKHVYEIHKTSLNTKIHHSYNSNKSELSELMKFREPIIIHTFENLSESLLNLSFNNLNQNNPGYIINDNDKFITLSSFDDNNIKQISVYRNQKLCHDFKINNDTEKIDSVFSSQITCNNKYYLSLFKGPQMTPLEFNKNNLLIIHQITGMSSIYLFNPKYKNDIESKNNSEIKKWSFKVELKPNATIYIPIQWLYFIESENDCIFSEITADNIFTILYNSLR